MSVQAKKNVRTARLELRLSVQERERIEAKAKSMGMSLSDYIRMAALGFAQMRTVPPAGASSKPPVEAPIDFDAALAAYPVEGGFKCPVHRCEFRPTGGTAICPYHGRRVIPT